MVAATHFDIDMSAMIRGNDHRIRSARPRFRGSGSENLHSRDVSSHRADALGGERLSPVKLIVVLLVIHDDQVVYVGIEDVQGAVGRFLVIGLGKVVQRPVAEDDVYARIPYGDDCDASIATHQHVEQRVAGHDRTFISTNTVHLGWCAGKERGETHWRSWWDYGGNVDPLRAALRDSVALLGEAGPQMIPESIRAVDQTAFDWRAIEATS